MRKLISLSILVLSIILNMGCEQHVLVLLSYDYGNSKLFQVDLETGEIGELCPNINLGNLAQTIRINGNQAYITDNDSVHIINLMACTLESTIALLNCSPWEIVPLTESNKAYLTCSRSNTVPVIDLQNYVIMTEISLPPTDDTHPASPTEITISENKAFVANTGFSPDNLTFGPPTVTVIDIATDTIVDVDSDPNNGLETPMEVDDIPQDLVVDTSSILYVTYQNGSIDAIDTISLSRSHTFYTGGLPGIIAISENKKGYITSLDGQILVIDTVSREVLRNSDNPIQLAISERDYISALIPYKEFIYATTYDSAKIHQISTKTDSVMTEYELEFHPVGGDIYTLISIP
jgi:DNA-binding beta-propeller fold protein YncE